MAHLKRLRVLCSSVRVLLPVRSSSCRVAGSESDRGTSFSSLQLKSTSYQPNQVQVVKITKHPAGGSNSEGVTDLDFGQVEDLWEDGDVIGVRYERVQPLAAGHGGRYRLQLVATEVQLLQLLQLTQLAEDTQKEGFYWNI